MPELPDVTVYIECLERRVRSVRIVEIRIRNPFVLRSVAPPIESAHGRVVRSVRRMGKRIVFDLGDEHFLVVHLMIAGRFQWQDGLSASPRPSRITHASIVFDTGTLTLTEAATKKRASLRIVAGRDELRALDPGGLEVLESGAEAFRDRLLLENHTLKRALTDPRLFSGIGNAYSDEILHDARLSPVRLSHQLSEAEIEGLRESCVRVLTTWTDRLRREVGEGFPSRVTAFREEMSVHGRYGKPCPVCSTAVQRIAYAENETNYCPRCQTSGKLLADRSLSRLLKGDWPRTIEELEEARAVRGADHAPDVRGAAGRAGRSRPKPRFP